MTQKTTKTGWYRVQTLGGEWGFAHYYEVFNLWTYKGDIIHEPDNDFSRIAEMVNPNEINWDRVVTENVPPIDQYSGKGFAMMIPEGAYQKIIVGRNDGIMTTKDTPTPQSEPYEAGTNISAAHPAPQSEPKLTYFIN